jgi:hypothetical protein
MTTEAGQRLADVAAVARAFLAATAETKPDTPRAELWHLLVAYRTHLALVGYPRAALMPDVGCQREISRWFSLGRYARSTPHRL